MRIVFHGRVVIVAVGGFVRRRRRRRICIWYCRMVDSIGRWV